MPQSAEKVIGRKLAVLVTLSVAASLFVLSGFSVIYALSGAIEEKHRTLTATAQVFAFASATAARKGDAAGGMAALRAIGQIDTVTHARIERGHEVLAAMGRTVQLDRDSRFRAEGVRPGILDVLHSRTIEVAVPITDAGEQVGTLVLVAATDDLFRPIVAMLFAFAAATAAALAIGLMIAAGLRRSIIDPVIRRLAVFGRYVTSKEVRDLLRAIEAGEMTPIYQPIMDASGRRIVGVEALVRWQRADASLVPPAQFIPLAEGAGLIARIGELVLRRACLDTRDWGRLTVAINVSPMQIQSEGFAAGMLAILAELDFPPARLVVEITESALLGDDPVVHRQIAALRAAGIAIALDDFGTGFASLSYLRRFRFDELKIDKSFTEGVDSSTDAAAIVEATVSMALALGMKVVAEGVERVEQHRFLVSAGVHYMQGYLFGRPQRAAEITARLAAHPA